MAGKPITRAYTALVDKVGISNILDRVANGETMGVIAASIGVSRWFLSTYLNKDDFVADALDMCRAQAAQKRLAAHPKGVGSREARRWVAEAPALHLAALKAIRSQDRGETERKPDAGVGRVAALKAFRHEEPTFSAGTRPSTSVAADCLRKHAFTADASAPAREAEEALLRKWLKSPIS